MSTYDDEGWTWSDFLGKMDSEGGIEDVLSWGGPGSFPPEIREDAKVIDAALARMNVILDEHGY